MLDELKYDIIKLLSSVEISNEADVNAVEEQRRSDQSKSVQFLHPVDSNASSEEYKEPEVMMFKRDEKKVGRNDPCVCGSGKKYKACHGRLA